MKLLLDTHVILWALTDDPRLSEKARALILDTDSSVFFSTASLWEIAIKNFKAPEKCPYREEVIAELCEKAGYLPLDIRREHIRMIRTLRLKPDSELSNYDPFDRLLIAQAKAEGYRLLSHDSNFRNYEEASILMI